jgi:hypothetical protein
MASKSVEVTKTVDYNIDDQKVQIHITAVATIVAFATDNWKHLSLTLGGSHVRPASEGKLKWNQVDIRGWYTESILVEAHLRGPEVDLLNKAPGTTSNVSTLTSNNAFNIEAGMGAMGPLPILQIGGGATVGSIYSVTFQDFRVDDYSSGRSLKQQYRMASTKEGSPYEKTQDLVPDGWSLRGLGGCLLYNLPGLATANFSSIVSQGLWKTINGNPEDGNLIVKIDLTLAKVEKTFKLFSVHIQPDNRTFSASLEIPIPFTQLKGN